MKHLLLLPTYTLATTTLQQKQQQLTSLQTQLDSRLSRLERLTSFLSHDDNISSSIDKLYGEMDEATLKLTSLIGRTKGLLSNVGRYNKRALEGVRDRIDEVLEDELDRRGRFVDWKNSLSSDQPVATSSMSEYISLEQLQSLISEEKLISPTEEILSNSIMDYTKSYLEQKSHNESLLLQEANYTLHQFYAKQYASIQSSHLASRSCLSIPDSITLIENELHHYYLGVDMVDYASYENGGSVVYSLTSGSFVPPPRNEVVNSEDLTMEKMYYDQQSYLNSNAGVVTQTKRYFEQHLQKWYENYHLGDMREYLPQDWERAIDWGYSKLSSDDWDEYTPQGAMDALVADYVWHGLGFGEFARTCGAEVAIDGGGGGGSSSSTYNSESGGSSRGGAGGSGSSSRSAHKHVGSCYPLSMHSEDDPALSYLRRFEFDDERLALLAGPKYTVRLGRAVYIDAVTVEHRSFPTKEGGGGESAPRHVRVVGFPPCSDEDEECAMRGFEIKSPLDLGSFEYERVTLFGDDDEDESIQEEVKGASSKRRKRSVQTFAVKGGKWKPQQESKDETTSTPSETEQCSLDDLECNAKQSPPEPELDPIAKALAAQGGGGECKPNYEDMQAVPDCDGDDSDSSSTSSGERSLVAAVSFIIEENWGNPEYTCLYRVQVHGDAV